MKVSGTLIFINTFVLVRTQNKYRKTIDYPGNFFYFRIIILKCISNCILYN